MEYNMAILHKVSPDTDPNLFPRNTLCDELTGVSYKETIWIDFDNIVVNPDDNIFRAGGNNLTNQNNLKESLSIGIYTSETLPTVERLLVPFISSEKKGFGKDYIARDGFNRINALRDLGYTGYWFDVMLFKDDLSRAMFSARSNRHCPKAASSDVDMKNMIRNLVSRKVVKNDPEAMKDWLIDNCAIRSNRATRLVNEVSNATSLDGIVIYSTPQLRDLANDLGIEVDGKYDLGRQEFGYHIRSMYEGRTLQKILRNFRLSNGKTLSYATICTRLLPSIGETIDDQREDLLTTLEEYEEDLNFYAEWKRKHPGEKCWHIMGALPQTKSEREKKEIVPVE